MAVSALTLVLGCTRSAPVRTDVTLPLPPDAIDVTPLDGDRFVVLRGKQQKAITVVSRSTGSVLSNFAVPARTVGLAYGGPDRLIDLLDGNRPALELRSTGGELQKTVPLGQPVAAVVGVDAKRTYVLFAGRRPAIAEVDLDGGRVARRIAAPAASSELAAGLQGLGIGFVVSDRKAAMSALSPTERSWSRLQTPGRRPVLSMSGSAIYGFQQIGASRVVAVIALPYRLQVRLFPVSLSAVHMSASPDGTLAIFEQTQTTADVRFIACTSPLLAIEPRYKHGKFFGGGVPWQLLGLATPDPQDTDPPVPSDIGVASGC